MIKIKNEYEKDLYELFDKYYFNKQFKVLKSDQLHDIIKGDPDYKKFKGNKSLYTEYLKLQEEQQKKQTKNKKNDKLHTIYALPNSYQIDIIFLAGQYPPQLNEDYTSLLNCIEITTRKAYSYPLKTKNQEEVYKAFKQFLKDINNELHQIEVDGGNEFNLILKYCRTNTPEPIVTLIYIEDKYAMSIVERFNRTLRIALEEPRVAGNDGIWIDDLKDVIKNYNNTILRNTGYKPNEMEKSDELQKLQMEDSIWKGIPAKLELNKYKIGDKIRSYKKREFLIKAVEILMGQNM